MAPHLDVHKAAVLYSNRVLDQDQIFDGTLTADTLEKAYTRFVKTCDNDMDSDDDTDRKCRKVTDSFYAKFASLYNKKDGSVKQGRYLLGAIQKSVTGQTPELHKFMATKSPSPRMSASKVAAELSLGDREKVFIWPDGTLKVLVRCNQNNGQFRWKVISEGDPETEHGFINDGTFPNIPEKSLKKPKSLSKKKAALQSSVVSLDDEPVPQTNGIHLTTLSNEPSESDWWSEFSN